MAEITWGQVSKWGVSGVFAVAAGVAALNSYKIVPSQSYGVRVTMGQMTSDNLKPNFYLKSPLFDDVYVFNNNTIILSINSVGSPSNTADQNSFSASIRLHYKIDPKVGSMALNIGKLKDNNGEKIITDFAGNSIDAVVGSRPAADSMADPEGLLRAFKENLTWRLSQNNVPIRIDSIELLETNIGGYRKVLQLRMLPTGEVIQMSGPSNIAIKSGGQEVAPATVEKVAPPQEKDPTVATGRVLADPKVSP